MKSYIVCVKLKKKVVNDEYALESTVVHLEDLTWGMECRQLLDALLVEK